MDNPEIVRLKNAVSERDHTTSSSSAPVTLLQYGNFECIHCGRLYPVLKELRKLLGEQLRFVFRHFPIVHIHPHSLRAAEASEAAGAQDRFWEMHDQLFTHQDALNDTDLVRHASHLGLNAESFAYDMAEHTFLKQIETDYNLSLFDEHVTGTPTIYINQIRYTGANDRDSLLQAIKEADTEGRIRLPENHSRIGRMFARLRRDGNP